MHCAPASTMTETLLVPLLPVRALPPETSPLALFDRRGMLGGKAGKGKDAASTEGVEISMIGIPKAVEAVSGLGSWAVRYELTWQVVSGE